MARDGTLPLTEPVVIECAFAEGCYIELRDEVVRLVFFVDLEKTDAGNQERRITRRVAMPRIAAAALGIDLIRVLGLTRGGSH